MDEAHAFSGLKPGDYFIHRFDFDGQITYAYGILRAINAAGHYESDYQARQAPTRPVEVEKEAHLVLGKISKKACVLARLRNWPNTPEEVEEIMDFSNGKPVRLTLGERVRLLLA